MAVTFDSTWGGAAAEAYLTVEQADELIRKHAVEFDAWAILADEDDKARAIIKAADDIGGLRWQGRKYSYLQALAFPRFPEGITVYENSTFQGTNVDQYFILQERRVKLANALQALWILQNGGRDAPRELWFQGFGSRSRGMRFSEGFSFRDVPYPLHPNVWNQLRTYRSHGPRWVRGGSNVREIGDWE